MDPDGRQPYNPRNFYGEDSVFSGNFDPNSTLQYGIGSFGYTNYSTAFKFAEGDQAGGGSNIDGITFTDPSMIAFIQQGASQSGFINGLFSIVDQLKGAGYTQSSMLLAPNLEDITKVSQIETVTELISMLNAAAGVTGKSPSIQNANIADKGKSEGWRILLNISKIKTVLELAYVIGHEVNHSITDYFRDTYYDTVRNRTNLGAQGFVIFSEYRSYGWEITNGNKSLGNDAWDVVYNRHGPHPEIEEVYKKYNKLSPFYLQAAFDLVKPHLNELNRSYNNFYKKLKN